MSNQTVKTQETDESVIGITVQVLSLIDGEIREVRVRVSAKSEQDAVDKMFALAKDEKGYRFLGEHGWIKPANGTGYKFPKFDGEWFARS